MDLSNQLKIAMDAALRAGGAILQIYARDFEVEFKADDSPLTEADKAAHHIICDALEDTGLPILSEESKTIAYDERKDWSTYWLVDPLDGTKEFIKKNGEFTVNIALIENGRPVLGVVFAPVLGIVYCGMSNVESGTSEAWKAVDCTGKSVDEILSSSVSLFSDLRPLSSDLRPPSPDLRPSTFHVSHSTIPRPLSSDLRLLRSTSHVSHSTIRVVASRSHCNDETKAFIAELEKEGRVELVSSGSSLKLCRVAEGSADIYPRIAPTMEWDTAAAQAVVEAAGGKVVKYDPAVPVASYFCGKLDVESGASHSTPHISHLTEALSYNKVNLLNPYFVVSRF